MIIKERPVMFIGNARQRELAEYLQSQKASTAQALAERFNVTERTIRSDVKKLCRILPIDVRPGRYDGGIFWTSEKELYTFK